MIRLDAKEGYYATVAPDSRPYGITLSSTVVAYVDLPPGEYQGWVDGATAGAVLRMAYIAKPAGTTPTVAAADMPAVTAGASAQASPYPVVASTSKTITGGGEVPADASRQQIFVSAEHRLALLTSAGGGTLRLTQVL